MVDLSLRERILKNSTLNTTEILEKSILFEPTELITTSVPMVNAALTGRIDGGMVPGLLQIAGESKHFKTAFGLLLVTSFLKKYPEGVIMFYDSEFGTPKSYFHSFGINPANVVHIPITNIEEFRFDIVAQLEGLKRGDPIMIFVDSIGNLASLKEVEDAMEQKTVSDMTRARALKSLFRTIYGKVVLKRIPFVAVNHTYKEMALYPKDIVSGGSGPKYNSNDIWIITRQQEKDKNELTGFNFVINIEKSRFVKEKSKIPITVTFEKGIHKWSGLLDLAIEFGHVLIPKQGWYSTPFGDKNYRWNELVDNEEFWKKMFEITDFVSCIEKKYALPKESILNEEE